MIIEISQLMKQFATSLKHHNKSDDDIVKPWVFWDATSEFGQSFDDMLNSALSNLAVKDNVGLIQFWAKPKIDDKLTVCGPFAMTCLETRLAEFRKLSISHEYYKTDVNNAEEEHMLSPGPTSAFLQYIPCLEEHKFDKVDLEISVMLPIEIPLQGCKVGVLEIAAMKGNNLGEFVLQFIDELKKVGLTVHGVQNLMSCKVEEMGNLKSSVENIKKELKFACEEHKMLFAQVWIACDIPATKEALALKLLGYIKEEDAHENWCNSYFRLSSELPVTKGETVSMSLEDLKSRFAFEFYSKMFEALSGKAEFGTGALTLCLADDKGFKYVFEFVGMSDSNRIKDILLTLKERLPDLKFADGKELDSEMDVIVVAKAGDTEEKIKICKEKLKGKAKLTKEAVEGQFGIKRKEAAKKLGVGETTLREYVRELGIPEWPGPAFMARMKKNPSLKIYGGDAKTEAKEVDNSNGTDEEITIKAKYQGDKVKFLIKEVKWGSIYVELRKRFEGLTNFKVKYLDPEDNEWYLATNDDDLQHHIKSLEKKIVELWVESKEAVDVGIA